MGKLIKMNTIIVGMRGLGVEVAKNLILAGPKSVSLYDPTLVALNDLGANFYCEEKHVGNTTRAEACLKKLQELNPYVKVEVIADRKTLEGAISSGEAHVCCQTEILLLGEYVNPGDLDALCRKHTCGYISSQTFGPWGYAFVDYGDDHIVTDHDGEQTKSFIVVNIEKGDKVTKIWMHEDKRHIYQEGDHVVLREVEGMTQINELPPLKIVNTRKDWIEVELDSTSFGDYLR